MQSDRRSHASETGFRDVRYIGRIPKAWDVERIGDLFHDQLGKMLSQKSKTGISYRPYLGNWNVQWGRFDLQRVEQMDFSLTEAKKFALKLGDVLVCEGGEVGRTAIWHGEIEDCCYQKALHRLRPRNHRMTPEFFMHFMKEAISRDVFRRYTNESSIAHLTREMLIKIQIPCPPLAEQNQITRTLDAVDDAIERTRGVIDQTRRLKTALLQNLLTHGLPGRKTQFKTVRLGELFAECRERGVHGLPVMSVTMNAGLVPRESLDRRLLTELTAEQHLLARAGDIAYNMMRMWQGVSGLAETDCLISPAYVVLRPKRGMDSRFAAYFFKAETTIRLFHRYSQGLVDDRLRLYFQHFKPIRVRIPQSINDQARMAEILGVVDARVAGEDARLDQLITAKTALSQALLIGRVRARVRKEES